MDDIQLTFNGSATARIAPEAGFCCLSWIVDGREHLHLPVPEEEFRTKPKTGGIPLLYPYANRLRTDPWPGRDDVKRDDGVPCHGFLLRFSSWDKLESSAHRAEATLEWSRHEELMSLFPYGHSLKIAFELGERSLRATTTVAANAGVDVPISFGWHPYLSLAPTPHEDLNLVTPMLRQVQLDAKGIPVRDRSGALQLDASKNPSGSLAGRAFDDLYQLQERGAELQLMGDTAGIHMRLDSQWSYIQIYSPADADFACIEPMTAPVAALSDDRDHPTVKSGETFEATFEMSVV